MKKKLAFGVMSAAMALGTVLAPAVQAAPNNDSFTLTYWTFSGYENEKSNPDLKVALSLFKKQYPNVTVQILAKGRPEQELQALQTSFMANNPPDIFFNDIAQGDVGQFIKDDEVLDIGKYVKQYGWDKDFTYSLLKNQNHFFGGVYGVPQDYYWMGLWYKKDLLAKYHLPVPHTYQQLLNDSAVLKAHNIIPMLEGGKIPALIDRLFDASLANISPPSFRDKLLLGKASFNSPYIAKAFSMVENDFVKKGYFQPGYLSDQETQVYQLWYPSKGAFWLSGSWEFGNFITAGQKLNDYGFVPFPNAQNSVPEFGNAYFISKASKHADAAAAFINDLVSLKAQRAQSALDPNTARIGAINVKKLPPLQQYSIHVLQKNPSYVLLNEMGLSSSMTDQLYTVTEEVVMGQMTPQQAAQSLDSAAKQYGWYKN